jgi:CDP-4-dehydro-6-deoxyglucose reductase
MLVVPVVRISSGRTFDVAEGESLLDAATRAGVTLAYSCRTGRCGTCRGRLIAGSTSPIHHELGLDESDRRGGWILTCVRSAQSNVDLEVDDLGNVPMFAAKTLPCRIHSRSPVSEDVLRVLLRLPPSTTFTFHPGQYIDVIGRGGLRRSYSIANAPAQATLIELHIRRVVGGQMSKYWFDEAKDNDLLRLHGPLGTFFLRNVADFDLVFLATGTGIAPVKAIIEGLAQGHSSVPRSVTILWGGRVPQDMYWNTKGIGVDHQFVPVLSRGDLSWEGARGYVQEVFLSTRPDLQRAAVYACGSEIMINDARRQLVSAGLSERQFFSDAFVCSASA